MQWSPHPALDPRHRIPIRFSVALVEAENPFTEATFGFLAQSGGRCAEEVVDAVADFDFRQADEPAALKGFAHERPAGDRDALSGFCRCTLDCEGDQQDHCRRNSKLNKRHLC
jgi:hypothetical protein